MNRSLTDIMVDSVIELCNEASRVVREKRELSKEDLINATVHTREAYKCLAGHIVDK